MSETLVLEIEIPGFNVDEIRQSIADLVPEVSDDAETIDEQLEISMGCDEDVVVVFHISGWEKSPANELQAMNGRIRRRRTEVE